LTKLIVQDESAKYIEKIKFKRKISITILFERYMGEVQLVPLPLDVIVCVSFSLGITCTVVLKFRHLWLWVMPASNSLLINDNFLISGQGTRTRQARFFTSFCTVA
jgi:hypothetical protein